MRDVAIIFDGQDSDYAQEIAAEFVKQGYPIFSWPVRLNGADLYRQISSTTKIKNHSNIFLVSLALFRRNRLVLDQLSQAINQKRTNIHIVSMDDQWYKVKSDPSIASIVEHIQSISYFPEPKIHKAYRPGSEIAKSIIDSKRITETNVKSFMSTKSLSRLLESLYDEVSVLAKVNEQSGRIHYTILDGRHRLTGKYDRYLAIFPDASIEASKDHIDYNFPTLLRAENFYVVRSQPQHELSLLQKERLSAQFEATPLRFETMVGGQPLKTSLTGTLFGSDEFIIGQRWDFSTRENTIHRTTDEMVTYFENDEELDAQRRIAIINGAGGSGKTHFVRHLHDQLSITGQEVFFLTANSVSNLKYVTTIETLYDIYACCCTADESSSVLSKDLFELKFLIDSPVIIVDGLEEITTMLGDRFNRDKFINDCIEKSNNISNGRIIITTREGRYPAELSDSCRFLTIHPFTVDEAELYFKKQFQNDDVRLRIATKLFASMTSTSEGIPPLFCDMISAEVRASEENEIEKFIDRQGSVGTSSLHAFVLNILERELNKTDVNLTSEQVLSYLSRLAQISVFGGLSVTVALKTLEEMWSSSDKKSRQSFVENLVFLKYDPSRNLLTFRYEFLTTLFLAQYVREKISSMDTSIFYDRTTRAIFTNNLLPGADVDARLILDGNGEDTNALLDSIELLIEFVTTNTISGASEHERRLLSSNLLYLRLALDRSVSGTSEVKEVFHRLFRSGSDAGTIRGLSIMHFDQGREHRFKFDLQDFIVEDGWFYGIQIGASLLANGQTKFRRCRFFECDASSVGKRSGLFLAAFEDNCEMDAEFSSVLAKLVEKSEYSKERKRLELKRFLQSFNAGYDFSKARKKTSLVGEFVSRTGLRTTELIDILLRHRILEPDISREDIQYKICEKSRTKVRQFVMDGIVGKEIRLVLNEM